MTFCQIPLPLRPTLILVDEVFIHFLHPQDRHVTEQQYACNESHVLGRALDLFFKVFFVQ